MLESVLTHETSNRRPIRARSTKLARMAAAGLARAGVSANTISLASLVFAALAAVCLLLAPLVGPVLYILAAIFIPFRLFANLLDGMVAVEHGKASALGPLFNEVPDRFADVLLIAAAGHAAALVPGAVAIGAWSVPLGWLAAALALMTAYVRELGRALGGPADFSGPFAKQHRMWVLVAASVLAFAMPDQADILLLLAVVVLVLGTGFTAYRRTHRLAAFLNAQTTTDAPDGAGGGGVETGKPPAHPR